MFHDILFHTLPGAFETEYQTAPLDLVLDTFYSSRKAMIDQRLSEILAGKALEIATKADTQHRPQKTFFVGAQWDTFSTEEILEIVKVSPNYHIGSMRVLRKNSVYRAKFYMLSANSRPLITLEPGEEFLTLSSGIQRKKRLASSKSKVLQIN